MDQKEKSRIMNRLREIRTKLLCRYPFWGTLLLHLQLGLADCRTAYTDMKYLVFDPAFVNRLDDEQTAVVMMHEVMHCALAHCLRAANHQRYLYNVACDIVVNSMLLWTMGYREFEIDGANLMHLTPGLEEGRLYTAEEVYGMLLRKQAAEMEKLDLDPAFLDRHDQWNHIDPDGAEEYEWENHIREAKKYMAGDKVCQKAREIFGGYRESKIDWRKHLQSFLHQVMNREDYSFIPYDKRYSYSDLILPAFGPEESGAIRNIWFCVDTSGSITKEELTALVGEIRQAFFQFRNFKGKLSYFDYAVTEPAEFESVVDLEKCTPVGGGGTSFRAIFWYMQEHMKDDLPEAVVIMTDGCAPFPNESCAMGVPVLWVIINSDVRPPWGEVIYIEE